MIERCVGLLRRRRAKSSFLLGKVSNKMTAKFVVLGHDVEQEGFDIVV